MRGWTFASTTSKLKPAVFAAGLAPAGWLVKSDVRLPVMYGIILAASLAARSLRLSPRA